MMIDEKRAIALLKKYGLTKEKIIHSVNVANISKFIAEKLNEKGIKSNANLVYSGALLHDIGYFKGATEKDRINHSKIGADILKKEGLAEYSEIVLRHDIKGWVFAELAPITIEQKIVNYADKREKNGKIISIKEREDIFLQFFTKDNEWLKKAFKELGKFEKELFDMLGMKSEDLKKFVNIE